MEQIDTRIEQIIATGKFDDKFFTIENFRNKNPYVISEPTFLRFINFAKANDKNKQVFREIEPFITFSYNVTDRVFSELLLFAKKNEWMYLGLCHANLPVEKVKILKNLHLPESYWF